MERMMLWNVLGIDETKNEEDIKAAYRRKLMHTNPEDDPEGFKKLRQAYEMALELMYKEDEEYGDAEYTEHNLDEVDRWILKAKIIYSNWNSRMDINKWNELLEDNVCVSLDTADEASEKMLVFLMSNYHLRDEVWRMLDSVFDYLNLNSEIREKFPPNFYGYVCNQIRNKNFLNYEDLTGGENADYDAAIENYSNLKIAVYNNDEDKIKESSQAIKDSGVYHPYFDVENMIVLIDKLSNPSQINSEDNIRNVQFDALQEYIHRLENYKDDFYITAYLGHAYVYLKDFETAKEYLDISKSLNVNFHDADFGIVKYYMALGQNEDAKEYIKDYLQKNENDEEGLYYLYKINENLINQYYKKIKSAEPEDLVESPYVLKIGWCMFQNRRYEDAINMLEAFKPKDEDVMEYCSLLGRCYLQYGDNEKAMSYLGQWLNDLYSLEDDGTELYKNRIKKLGYAYYLVGLCFVAKGDNNNKEKPNSSEGDNLYKKAIPYIDAAIEIEESEDEKLQYVERKLYILTKLFDNNKAVEICDTLIEKYPDYYPAFYYRQMANFNMNKSQNVIDDFYKCIDLYNQDAEPYIYAVRTFMKYKQYSDAMGIIYIANDNQVESDRLKLLELTVARNTIEDSDTNEYEELFKRADTFKNQLLDKSNHKNTADNNENQNYLSDLDSYYKVYYEMAMILRDSGRLDEAMELLESISDKEEVLIDSLVSMAAIYNSWMDYDSEENTLLRLLKYYKDNIMGYTDYTENTIWVYSQLGECCYNKSDYEKALFYYESGYKYDKHNTDIINDIAEIYIKFKRYEEAEKILLPAVSLIAKNGIESTLFDAYLCQEKYDMAEALVDKIEKAGANKQWIHDLYFEVYCKMHAYEKAFLRLSQEDIEELTDITGYYDDLAFLAYKTGRIEEVEKSIRALKDLAENEETEENKRKGAFEKIADLCHLYYGNLEKSIENYQKSMEIEEDKGNYRDLCRLYSKLGMKDKARECYEIYVNSLIDKYGSIEHYLEDEDFKPIRLYILGKLYYYTEQYDMAEQCFEQMDKGYHCCMCNFGKCYEQLIGRGLILKAQGKLEEAKEQFIQAMQIDGSDSECLEEIEDLKR